MTSPVSPETLLLILWATSHNGVLPFERRHTEIDIPDKRAQRSMALLDALTAICVNEPKQQAVAVSLADPRRKHSMHCDKQRCCSRNPTSSVQYLFPTKRHPLFAAVTAPGRGQWNQQSSTCQRPYYTGPGNWPFARDFHVFHVEVQAMPTQTTEALSEWGHS